MNSTFQQRVDRFRSRLAMAIAPPPIHEKIHIAGHIRVRELPFSSEAEWKRYWLGDFDSQGRMIRPPRMSKREKEQYTVAESENTVVSAGITQILTFLGSRNGSSVGFAQYFAFGNGGLNAVSVNDTSLVNELFRLACHLASSTAVNVDISVLNTLGGSPVQITETGLYGNGASSTIGSGTLLTHSLLSYTQPVAGSLTAVSYDYFLTYN